MAELLILVGVIVAVFVGFNIGGSSTGVAFGPAVGSRIVRKVTAGALFTVFAFLGAWTIGRNVITTMSSQIVDAAAFTPAASVGVLFFTGLALLISNLYGVPASTSMTAVGAIVGLGLATGTLNAALMFTILSAWIVAPLIALSTGALIGRYLYPYLDATFAFGRLTNPLIAIDTRKTIPRLSVNENVSPRDIGGSALVVVIACYMGFSAGASNAANAVAPLVGNGAIDPSPAILLAVGAISLGGFTIARRTLATVGDDITDLPILAALIVSTVGATIITVLSWLGIPASLAVSTTSCIIGLGWGRASRARTLAEIATPSPGGESGPVLTTGALKAPPAESAPDVAASPTVGDLAEGETPDPDTQQASLNRVPRVGEEEPEELSAESLFDPAATARIVALWVITPTISVVGAYLLFSLLI
ncbi:inorganic phosphate transporter [Haloplanus aerogenes]|uniref:Phosphate transporter n=1 Tax=Haloplanus aerogenes TaxID=660522 RepID=A0A3M0DPE2_9EURY|nr:inorganic phosphate transporter [Haloplanus aerogenes]AZH24715.1 inorganic phosphate transporter [Haloplanus aerogenes]RMB23627.1 PiT family inorganic phosphate transporter [Haloplanus aerogenes]